ncbi:porin, partial [Burkholderia cenocepacia]
MGAALVAVAAGSAGASATPQAGLGSAGPWGSVRAGEQNRPRFNARRGQGTFGGVTQAPGMSYRTVFAFRRSDALWNQRPKVAGFQRALCVGFG